MDASFDAGGTDTISNCEVAQELGESAICVWKYVVASGFPAPGPFAFHVEGPVDQTESTLDGKGGGVVLQGFPGGTYTLSESEAQGYTPFIDCVDVQPPIIEMAVARTFGSTTNTFAIGGPANNPPPVDDNPHCVVYNVGPLVTLTPTATPTNTATPTITATPTDTATPTATPTASSTATPTTTASASATVTTTLTATATPTSTATPSSSTTPSSTVTPSATASATLVIEAPSAPAIPTLSGLGGALLVLLLLGLGVLRLARTR